MTSKITPSLILRGGPLSLNDADWAHSPALLAKIRSMVAGGALVEGVNGLGSPGFACLPADAEAVSDAAAAAYEAADDAHLWALIAYVRTPSRDNLACVWDSSERKQAAFRALLAVS